MFFLLPSNHVAAVTSWTRATAKAGRAALLLFSLATLLAGGSAVRGQSALDGFDPNPNGAVRIIAVQPDGKILIGGDFTTLAPNGGATVTRNYIARLNPDGTLDAAFNPSADGSVLSFAVLADGKVVAGGDFTNIGGQPRQHLARLDGTTGLADSFDPGPNGAVRTIAVQADGKILVGGSFSMVGGVERSCIARFDGTTGLLDSFDPQAGNTVFSIVIQADGKILVGGHFILIGGEMRRAIARLDPTTGHADSFDPSVESGGFPQEDVHTIAVQADGKILLGGSFIDVGGEARDFIARVDPVTGHADSFNPNANEIVYSIAVQADGRILAAGNFTNIGGQPRNYIARLNPVTGLADSFDPHPSLNLATIAVQADGKVLAGGYFTTLAPNGGAAVTRNRIARLEADGRLDRTLDVNMFPIGVLATAVQPDGKILIGGGFTSVSGVARNHIARLNRDGTLDIAFDPNATGIVGADIVYSLAVQWDGKVLVGGSFTSVSGQPRNRIARLDATTGLTDSFDPDINGPVNAIALQADGRILASGSFSTVGGQTRMGLARIDPTTGLADSFNANADGSVASIVVQADGKIVTGGNFSSMGGQTRNGIARLDPTTGLADSFNPNANDQVFSITVQPDGKILAGGSFTSIGGQMRSRIARLDGTTGLADSFDPNANAFANVFSIAVQADGKVIAGGEFTSIGGQPRNGIARLDATTGLADSFDPNASGGISSIAVQGDGKILAGGGFNSISGQSRSGFARLTNDTSALQDLAVTEKTVTWTRSGSSPQFTRVSFAYSNDNASYVLLGNGTAAGSTWTMGGLSLPTGQNFYIRARGYYRSGQYNGSESITESVRSAFLPPPTKAINVSTRMLVQTGENVGIGGFIITGSIPKRVLIRGIGPSLILAGVPNCLNDPTLELFNPDHSIAYNNDWQDTDGSAIRATGLSPFFDLEAALLVTLPAGSYTAVVRGNNGGTGVALVEVYDLNQGVDSKLANLSTRAFVGTNDDIVIAGCTLGGDGDDRIVLRGIGPSLAAFGVTNALANPTLELRDAHGALLSSNNDWQDDVAQAAELIAAGLAPSSNLEAAIAVTLPPGPYTALLAGRNNGTGVGVVEIYDRGAP